MARPTTKQGLIEAANGDFGKLWKLVDSMSPQMQNAEFAFEGRNRNLRDVEPLRLGNKKTEATRKIV